MEYPDNEPTFELVGGRMFRREPPREVRDAKDIISRIAGQEVRRATAVFALEDKLVRLASRFDGSLILGVVLDHIRLDTNFSLFEDIAGGKFLSPVFRGNRNTVHTTCLWKPPDTMEIHFAVHMSLVGDITWQMIDSLLFARPINRPGFFKLPLPNTFGDGRMCLGNGPNRINGDTAQEVLTKAHTMFESGVWNTDLIDEINLENTRKLFQFDPSNFLPIPPPEEWEQCCRRVSSTTMEDLLE
jgi:hypothetical protein